jgi:hypothetical protein
MYSAGMVKVPSPLAFGAFGVIATLVIDEQHAAVGIVTIAHVFNLATWTQLGLFSRPQVRKLSSLKNETSPKTLNVWTLLDGWVRESVALAVS